ncbi:hypothetical protein [Dactylosporangium sp. CA-233914]|uniref:hypothetical protein n=1 Tax=Dactylosporangium sp. CA-233914 TaxID=3239934 RepID=UPI003D8C9F36
MSLDELDLDSLDSEPVVPSDPRQAALWAARIGLCAVFVLFLLLTSDLVFGRTVALAAPERIGPWAADPQLTETLDRGVRAAQDELGAEPFTAAYTDDDGRMLLLWGGTGLPVKDADDAAVLGVLRETMLGFVIDGGRGAVAAGADPGRHHGKASCTVVRYGEARYTVCVWTLDEAALAMLVVNGTEPGDDLRTVLDAVVTMR